MVNWGGFYDAVFKAWDESKHPRHPKGTSRGGQFAPKFRQSIYEGEPLPQHLPIEGQQEMAREIAREMGFEDIVSRIGIRTDLGNVVVEGKIFPVAAVYDPMTDTIELREFGFFLGKDEFVGALAHELQHRRFDRVTDEYRRQEDLAMLSNALQFGKLKPEFSTQYPVLRMMRRYDSDPVRQLLIRKDGVTRYSRAWWESFKGGRASFDMAVDETLAEIASLRIQGRWAEVPSIWREFYRNTEKMYRSTLPLSSTKAIRPGEPLVADMLNGFIEIIYPDGKRVIARKHDG